MTGSIIVIVLGLVVEAVGVYYAGRSARFTATTYGSFTVGTIDPGKAARGKNIGERMVGQLMKLVGAAIILYGIYVLVTSLI